MNTSGTNVSIFVTLAHVAKNPKSFRRIRKFLFSQWPIQQGFLHLFGYVIGTSTQQPHFMHANEYQQSASRTRIDKPDFKITDPQVMIAWNALGLAGEAGEVADLIKKGIFHQRGLDKENLKKELGDVLWYLTALCSDLGLTLEEVMQHNIQKLQARFPEGYDPERTSVRDGDAA